MKYLLYLVFPLFVTSCLMESNEKEYEQLLNGKHKLRKFNIVKNNKTTTSASWFLVVGSYNSSTKTDQKIRFYFMTNNGEYVFKEMDFNKVNIKIDSLAEIPYVRFYWKYRGTHATGFMIYEEAITRAVIYCKEEDFSPEININELR